MRLQDLDIDRIESAAKGLGIDLGARTLSEYELHDRYDEVLDVCCACETCGSGGSELKHTDPIAYRCGYNDWIDGEVKNGQLVELQDGCLDETQLEELKDALLEAIEELF